MRAPTHVRSGEVNFNMTPMIDVVFLLIIFFLVTSHLVKQETQMEVPLPKVAKADEAKDDEVPQLTITVTGQGDVYLFGNKLSREELRRRLVEKANDQKAKGLKVRIRSDRSVPYEKISPIMVDCADAGLWNVVFGVHRKEEAR